MKKSIESIALGTIFPKDQVNNVLEIVYGTANPTLALQILLGIYEEPVLPSHADIDKKGTCVLTSYDKWNDRVHFTYERNKQKGIYVSKDCDKTLITADNYKEFEVKYSEDNTTYHYVKLHEVETVTDSCYRETWEKNAYAMCA